MLYHKWSSTPGVQNVYVGYESFGAQADLDYFEEQMRTPNQGGSFPIMELAWPREGEGGKIDRVQRLGPDLRAHKIFVPYATKDDAMTAVQRRYNSTGQSYRVARAIRRKSTTGELYDVTADLKLQIHVFPFGGRVDLVDALSRIYDMEPKGPRLSEPSYCEPEIV